MTLTDKEINNSLKVFSDLSVNEGRIRLLFEQIKRLKALTQHVSHLIRMGLNPTNPVNRFDTTRTITLIDQRKIQNKF